MKLLSKALPLALSLSVALAAGSTARADDALDPVAQEAQQSFVEGREALKRGELGRALGLFKRSQELRPTPGTLLNLANVEEQLGKITTALGHLELALTQLPDDDDRLPVAKAGVERLKSRAPSLRIDRAVGVIESMRVKLDGAPVAVASLGADQPLDPGTYTVTTQSPGHEDRRYEMKLVEGAHLTLAVEPGKEIRFDAVAPQPPQPQRSAVQTAGFVAAGVGVAGLGLGAVTGILAITRKNRAAALCPDPARCSGDGRDVAGAGHALAAVSTASFVMGVAGVGAGVALVLLGRDRAPIAPGPSARIDPLVSPGFAGLGLSGSF